MVIKVNPVFGEALYINPKSVCMGARFLFHLSIQCVVQCGERLRMKSGAGSAVLHDRGNGKLPGFGLFVTEPL